MSASHSFTPRAVLASAAFLLLAVPGSAFALTPTVLDDGASVALSAPDAAQGPDGRIHIVAQGATPASMGNSSARQIYYMLVAADGTVLAAPTIINTGAASRKSRPRIVATSDNKAIVTVGGGNSQNLAVYAIKIDPSQDSTLDGGPLAAGAIGTQTTVGVSTTPGEHASVIDSAGLVHVIKSESSNLQHLSFNSATMAVVTAEHVVGSTWNRNPPAMAVDSSDNLHVVYKAVDVDANGPPSYKMLDNAGAILIDSTPLFVNGSFFVGGGHLSLFCDSNDHVHIVYGDKRNTIDAIDMAGVGESGGDAFYAELIPSRHAQDGTAGDITVLRVGPEVEIGNHWYGRAFRSGSTIHFFSGSHMGNTAFVHQTVSRSGGASAPRTLNDARSGGFNWSRPYPTSAGGNLIWTQPAFLPLNTGNTTQLVMAKMSSFQAPSSGGGGGALSPLALFILGLAGAARRRKGG